ncbi:Tryptophan halogenase [Sphingomonas sp. EC-HK361]|nr:Tryptophan halogenase [Sphingomonas sp. EC-HK361]
MIVGGGTAGWLAACRIAAAADPAAERPVSVTLVESPDIATIGVGEGTWPTMRRTMARIGIDEAELLIACDASFKQGSRFDGWVTGEAGDSYHHPFTPPIAGDPREAARLRPGDAFADRLCAQPQICALDLAPRQRSMPGYAGALNYAYHLDAAKLAALLKRHATGRLGVRHVRDHVLDVEAAEGGDIASVRTRDNGAIAGDLFIDCTGHAALLIGEHCGIDVVDRSDELFNDRALAVQVPVAPGSAIAAQTNATAHAGGWIWDIGLPTRRGVGCVYASTFMDDAAAEATLKAYLRRTTPDCDADALNIRLLTFRSAHRERFWAGNCLAIGQSAGFLEPLEASAIVMIELALDALIDDFPANRAVMAVQAERFNAQFRYRWDRIVEFLKLHYVLSRRTEPYWRAHRDAGSIPSRLAQSLELWRHRAPAAIDFPAKDEVFPGASYQFVLYGMGFLLPSGVAVAEREGGDMAAAIRQVEQRGRALAASLPTNRAYLDALRAEHAGTDPILERYAE